MQRRHIQAVVELLVANLSMERLLILDEQVHVSLLVLARWHELHVWRGQLSLDPADDVLAEDLLRRQPNQVILHPRIRNGQDLMLLQALDMPRVQHEFPLRALPHHLGLVLDDLRLQAGLSLALQQDPTRLLLHDLPAQIFLYTDRVEPFGGLQRKRTVVNVTKLAVRTRSVFRGRLIDHEVQDIVTPHELVLDRRKMLPDLVTRSQLLGLVSPRLGVALRRKAPRDVRWVSRGRRLQERLDRTGVVAVSSLGWTAVLVLAVPF